MSEHDFELDPNPIITQETEKPSTTSTGELLQSVAKSDLTFEYQQIQEYKGKISSSQEATRAKIAWTFTQIFLLIVMVALVLPTIVKIGFPQIFTDPIETTKTLLTLVASVLAGPFGFIVGFYFKQDQNT